MPFQLKSTYQPAGDQPQAIATLVKGVLSEERAQVLLGVTGSGKTFTIANVIAQTQKPTLVITHNKTLVTQLYGEFKQFFPDNAVACFVSYYDYYQPEAYLPVSGTYIEKDLSINEDLDKLRLKSIAQILSGRRDVLIVASVSCIYGAGNPKEYEGRIIRIAAGMSLGRELLVRQLVQALYLRTPAGGALPRGYFSVLGETVDIHLSYLDYGYRIVFWGHEIESIHILDPVSKALKERLEHAAIFPSNIYLAPQEELSAIIAEIREELEGQCAYFERQGKQEEAHRLRERVQYDIEMIKELGYCTGVENYSRFLDRRERGTRPFCLIDYFPKDFLCIIDESHQTIPQISGMYEGDRKRKMTLVEYGFRLPSALDNRPLNFYEFNELVPQFIYVSATPGGYELKHTEGEVVEQIVRPTGLLDPLITIQPTAFQIDHLLQEIHACIAKEERVLVTTLTKKMAEELQSYLQNLSIPSMYIHSDIDTLERVEIIRALRQGKIKVLVGVNLLREGLDIPEVALVAILDADKEGFLRNEKSLTQTVGRAARHKNGRAIFYADTVTDSMRRTMAETQRRRKKQMAYNEQHGIIPKGVLKSGADILEQTAVLYIKEDAPQSPVLWGGRGGQGQRKEPAQEAEQADAAPVSLAALEKAIKKAAKALNFIEAARLRDKLYALQKKGELKK